MKKEKKLCRWKKFFMAMRRQIAVAVVDAGGGGSGDAAVGGSGNGGDGDDCDGAVAVPGNCRR